MDLTLTSITLMESLTARAIIRWWCLRAALCVLSLFLNPLCSLLYLSVLHCIWYYRFYYRHSSEIKTHRFFSHSYLYSSVLTHTNSLIGGLVSTHFLGWLDLIWLSSLVQHSRDLHFIETEILTWRCLLNRWCNYLETINISITQHGR